MAGVAVTVAVGSGAVFDFVAPNEFPEIAAATGAMLIGRRTYEIGNRMEADKPGSTGYPFPDPCSS